MLSYEGRARGTMYLGPIPMETRCCQVFVSKLFKKNVGSRYSRTAAMGKKGNKYLFLILFLHGAARGANCAFTLKMVNTLIKSISRDDRLSISTLTQPTANPLRVGQGQ